MGSKNEDDSFGSKKREAKPQRTSVLDINAASPLWFGEEKNSDAVLELDEADDCLERVPFLRRCTTLIKGGLFGALSFPVPRFMFVTGFSPEKFCELLPCWVNCRPKGPTRPIESSISRLLHSHQLTFRTAVWSLTPCSCNRFFVLTVNSSLLQNKNKKKRFGMVPTSGVNLRHCGLHTTAHNRPISESVVGLTIIVHFRANQY